MRRSPTIALAVLAFITLPFAQDEIPTFRTQAASALVWEERNSSNVASSSVLDPVTGNISHRLSHGGIEVSSRVGFERISMSEVGEVLSFTTTVVNNTPSNLSVRYGGSSVDGRVTTPLAVAFTSKGLSKRKRKEVLELTKMNCFSSGFLAKQNFFSTNSLSQTFTVAPKGTLTVSFVTKDPRHYSMRCSVEGCRPTGTMRVAVTVNTTDFVFIWPGRSAVYCGK